MRILMPSRGHSSLGNHFIDLLDFRGLTDLSLVNPLKSSKNSKSITANIRMLGESLDSSGMESLESNLDFALDSTNLDSRDSIKDFSNSLKSNDDIKSSNPQTLKGEKGVLLRRSVAPSPPFITPSSPLHAFKVASHDNVEDSNDSLDSTNFADSNNLDSTPCVESNNNNPHEMRPLKSVVGGGGESCERGGGERLRNLSPLPLSQGIERVEDSNLINDSKELEDSINLDSKNSKFFKDSSVSNMDSNLDSNNLVIFTNLLNSLESKAPIALSHINSKDKR